MFPLPLSALLLISVLVVIRIIVLVCAPGLRRRTTGLHELGIAGFCLYLLFLCRITVNFTRILHGHFEMGRNYNVLPFAEITSIATSGRPLYALLNILGNILLFLPFGFSMPLLWQELTGMRVFILSLLLSGGIEVLQLFTGRSADIDDVILNAFGAAVGYLTYRILRAIHPWAVHRFRLRGSAGSGRQKAPVHSPQRPAIQNDNRPTPAVARVSGKQRRSWGKAALVTTALTLCGILSGAFLLSGYTGFFALSSPGAAPTLRHPQDNPGAAPVPLEIAAASSPNILLVSADTWQVLYEKQAGQRIYPASMTKIMTAVLALEHLDDLQEPIRLGNASFAGIYEANLATAGFQPGEEVQALDLIYGAMLPSGAECSLALAGHIAGSENDFAALMNEKARSLGLGGTHFVNATGLHHPEHYTTAADMALLLRYAMENREFRAISSTARHVTSPTSLHPGGITLASTLFARAGGTTFPGGAIIGGKTGYTDEAGQCLASFAEIDGREYILVTAGALPENYRTQQLHLEDALSIYSALGAMTAVGVV